MLQERVINSSKAVKISGGDDVTYLARNIVTRTFKKKVVLMFANQNVFVMQTLVQMVSQLLAFTKNSVEGFFHVENFDESHKL
jgi:hypothetical protein